jgi:hypothetical protein
LRAQVRHETSALPNCHVGLFFGHQTLATDQGPLQYFLHLSFNDINDVIHTYNIMKPILEKNGGRIRKPVANPVFLHPQLLLPRANGMIQSHQLGGLQPELFHPARDVNHPWRQLVVEVRPEGVKAFWEKERIALELSARECLPQSPTGWNGLRKFFGMSDVDLSPATLKFTPRSALGLFVSMGSASFRNVVIEPLSTSD